MSTFYDPRFAISKLMRIVEVDNEQHLDLLDPKLHKLLSQVVSTRRIIYDNSLPISSISYNAYRTTSLDWFILMYNGIIHELDIPNGTELKIPILRNIEGVFSDPKSFTRRGQRVKV